MVMELGESPPTSPSQVEWPLYVPEDSLLQISSGAIGPELDATLYFGRRSMDSLVGGRPGARSAENSWFLPGKWLF